MIREEETILPFYGLFRDLQKQGFQLGIPEYQLFFQLLRTGNAFRDKEGTLRLLKTIWYKPNQSLNVFSELFEKAWKKELSRGVKLNEAKDFNVSRSVGDSFSSKSTPTTESIPPTDIEKQTEEDVGANEFAEALPPTQEESITISMNAPGFKESLLNENLENAAQFLFTGSHLAMSDRQVKQSIQRIHHRVTKGFTDEIDIQATVESITQRGFLEAPIFVPKLKNGAILLVLADNMGSMVGFSFLVNKVIEVAQNANLKDIRPWYFYNVPGDHLFEDSKHKKGKKREQIFQERYGQEFAVMIISDAGAARGGYNQDRIDSTNKFLRELSHYTNNIAWLNPMPRNRWKNTSAQAIAESVKMFEADRNGIIRIVKVLRGK